MHEVLDIAKLVLIIIVSFVAFLLILKFSVDIVKNLRKINNIKKLKKNKNTVAAEATVFKASITEKGKEGKFRLVFFENLSSQDLCVDFRANFVEDKEKFRRNTCVFQGI